MTYIVENVARAIVDSRPIPDGCVRGEVDWEAFKSMARAALAATADNIERAHGCMHPGVVYIRNALKQ